MSDSDTVYKAVFPQELLPSLEAPDASALANLANLLPAALRSLTECRLATRQLRQFWRVKLQIAQPAIGTIERHQGVVSTLLQDFAADKHIDPIRAAHG
jgi:hypothetical protein